MPDWRRPTRKGRNDMHTTIEVSLSQGVLHLVFTTENGLNTMDDPWIESFDAHLRRATDDTAVRAVLLSGRGKVFCAGANLSGMSSSALHQGFAGSPLASFTERLATFPKPWLAAVHARPSAAARLCCCIAIWWPPPSTRNFVSLSPAALPPFPNWRRASCCPALPERGWRASCCCSAGCLMRTRRCGRVW